MSCIDRRKGQRQPRHAFKTSSHLCTFLPQVTKKPSLGGQVWADGSIFAVGDCNYGCIGEPGNWEMPPVPKISYPGGMGGNGRMADGQLIVKLPTLFLEATVIFHSLV